jgi:hypothetical protein
MSEGQPVNNREHDQGGDAASREEPDLQDPIVRERKLIQPLHAQSKTSAAERATNRSSFSPAERWSAWRPRSKIGRGSVTDPARRRGYAESDRRAPHVTFHNKSHFITKCDPVENCGARRTFAQVEPPAVKTGFTAHGSTRSTASESAYSRSTVSTAMSRGSDL